MRAEESCETQEGGNIYHVISGKTRNRYLVYKVNFHGNPFSCEIQINDMMRRSLPEGSVKGRTL